ncbi:hypothetical protein T03_6768 [Trichinella britovi]|uniref:Uncharacterized protein n=1 Tax=Trichinella britovi TaxID=45882 RepID=A0A0V1D3U5_TRIBR|nr:hypothetical protein T03_6768 [Trichinella britovi]
MHMDVYTSSLQCPVYKYVQWSIYRWIHLQKRKQLNTAGWSDVMQICSGRLSLTDESIKSILSEMRLPFRRSCLPICMTAIDSPERDTFL